MTTSFKNPRYATGLKYNPSDKSFSEISRFCGIVNENKMSLEAHGKVRHATKKKTTPLILKTQIVHLYAFENRVGNPLRQSWGTLMHSRARSDNEKMVRTTKKVFSSEKHTVYSETVFDFLMFVTKNYSTTDFTSTQAHGAQCGSQVYFFTFIDCQNFECLLLL